MNVDPDLIIEAHPGVYAPEEDSYLMIQALDITPGEKVLEIGCGTGIISLHCVKAGGKVTATDISSDAIECARANAAKNSLRLELIQSDMFKKVEGRYDTIVFNPPYLPSDSPDDSRWTGGESGLELSSSFLRQCKEYLDDNGKVMILISSLSRIDDYLSSASELGFENRTVLSKELFFETLYVLEHRLKR